MALAKAYCNFLISISNHKNKKKGNIYEKKYIFRSRIITRTIIKKTLQSP